MLHDLIAKVPQSHLPALAAMIGCSVDVLREAIAAKPGYRDHSVALSRVYSILRGDEPDGEPWPDGVDPQFVVDQAASIHAGLLACWSKMPATIDKEPRVIAVASTITAAVASDLAAMSNAGIREVVLTTSMDAAESLAMPGDQIVQIGYAPGLVRARGQVMGIEQWMEEQ